MDLNRLPGLCGLDSQDRPGTRWEGRRIDRSKGPQVGIKSGRVTTELVSTLPDIQIRIGSCASHT